MKNFTLLLLICFLFFSCAKENECPGGYTNSTVSTPPPPPPAPVATISISIDGAPMTITSFTYYRQLTGVGEISITAANDLQKVTAVAKPIRELGSGGYIGQMAVSYFTRTDNGSGWGVTYPRPIPRDDKMMFNECTPLRAKVINGYFSGSFIEPSSSPKEGDHVYITGNFSLVF